MTQKVEEATEQDSFGLQLQGDAGIPNPTVVTITVRDGKISIKCDQPITASGMYVVLTAAIGGFLQWVDDARGTFENSPRH